MAGLRRKQQTLTAAQLTRHLADARRGRDVEAQRLAGDVVNGIDLRARLVHRVGAALALLARDRLWANLGHASFDSLLASMGLGRSQARKWMAIATTLTEARAAELGVEAAYAAARSMPKRKHKTR